MAVGYLLSLQEQINDIIIAVVMGTLVVLPHNTRSKVSSVMGEGLPGVEPGRHGKPLPVPGWVLQGHQ